VDSQPQIAAIDPAKTAQCICEGCKTSLDVGVIPDFGENDVNTAQPVALLGECH
jgi:hypothetical protein